MIKQNMLRFTIPFHISNSSRKDLYPILEGLGWKEEHIVQGENDLYDYITDLVHASVVNDVASSWKLAKKLYSQEKYISEIEFKEVNWTFDEIGLVIFSTGVGILWYEINIKKVTDFNCIMDIAYAMKELARGEREKNYIKFSMPIKADGKSELDQFRSDLKMKISETISTHQGKVVKGVRQIELFNDVLKKYLIGIQIDSYFANRKCKGELMPDRAIPFSWVYEVNESGEINGLDNAFHLGRAYKSSYDMNSKIDENDFYIPFDDSIWYASLEGCANYTTPNREKSFYTGGYERRLNTYFYLYILCLGQYYSLLQLAHDVSVLPTDEDKYSANDDKLENLLDKIHVFNLKNNYSQVGHLTQHNEFYEYVQRRLGINKMQQELEVELQALFEMIERKKSIKQAKNTKVLTIIGGIFVVLQAFLNVAEMYGSVMSKEWGYFIFATIGCFVLAILGVILWCIDRIRDKKTERD